VVALKFHTDALLLTGVRNSLQTRERRGASGGTAPHPKVNRAMFAQTCDKEEPQRISGSSLEDTRQDRVRGSVHHSSEAFV